MHPRNARIVTVFWLALFSVGASLLSAWLALREPVLELQLRATADGGTVTTDRWVKRQPLDWQAAAWLDADGRPQPIDAALLIDEPDRLDTYTEWNAVLMRSGALWQALKTGTLTIVDRDGQRHEFETRPRRLAELPWLFWIQLAAGGVALAACALVWLQAEDREAALHFRVSALAFFVAAMTSAVYASRELALAEPVFRVLSRLNHLAGVLMPAAIAALQWRYPTRLVGLPVIVAGYGLALACVAVAQQQWLDAMPAVVYGPQALLYLLLLAGTVRQWQAGRTDRVKRSVLSIYLLALFAGTPICGALVLLPLLAGTGEPVSQTMMFVSFVPGYIGLAVGVAKHRLLDLSRWWFIAWGFFLASLALCAAYLLLRSGLGLARDLALTIAAALVGWAYFPSRRRVVRRLAGRDGEMPQRLLPDGLAAIAAAADPSQLNEAWREFLAARLRCLECEAAPADVDAVRVLEQGHALAVPGLFGQAFVLRYPDRGRRLFGPEDRRWIAVLHEIGRAQAADRLARQRGAREQRAWLKRELAESLREPLPVEVNARLTRLHAAIDDRACTRVEQMLGELEAAARTRCAAAGIRLRWRSELKNLGHAELSLRTGVTLERALSEAIGNALRHGRARVIEVLASIEAERLRLSVADDGGGGDPAAWLPGAGMQRIATRVAELGGDATWHEATHGVVVRIDIPL